MNIVDLLKDKLIDKNLNEFASIKNIKEDECVLAFYFAATWCEPCLAFTQLLISFYEDMAIKYDKKKCTKENKRFEVIFVSSDFNEEDFRENIKEMPWPSVAYKHCQLRVSSVISDCVSLVENLLDEAIINKSLHAKINKFMFSTYLEKNIKKIQCERNSMFGFIGGMEW